MRSSPHTSVVIVRHPVRPLAGRMTGSSGRSSAPRPIGYLWLSLDTGSPGRAGRWQRGCGAAVL